MKKDGIWLGQKMNLEALAMISIGVDANESDYK